MFADKRAYEDATHPYSYVGIDAIRSAEEGPPSVPLHLYVAKATGNPSYANITDETCSKHEAGTSAYMLDMHMGHHPQRTHTR